MRILHRGPEHCFIVDIHILINLWPSLRGPLGHLIKTKFLYHLICSLYLVSISMTGVHLGIQ